MDILIIAGLIIAGFLLFIIEVFLIPGISLAGIASAGCLLYANFYAFDVLGTVHGLITLCISAIGVIGITTFQTACRMFGVNADDYIVDIETLKKAKPMTGDEEIWMMQKSEHNLTDVVLCAESISNKLEITNQLLREIRGAIENAPDRTKDVVSKLDKMAGACNEIKSNTTHLIDIKKDVNFNRKSSASIDQRLNGINQIFASQRIAVDKIKTMVERFVSGK